MAVKTKEKIQKLEQEVSNLWQIVNEEIFWHPSVIRGIQRRSKLARRALKSGKLRTAEELFQSLHKS